MDRGHGDVYPEHFVGLFTRLIHYEPMKHWPLVTLLARKLDTNVC